MIFALKNSRLQRYINRSITKLLSLTTKIKKLTITIFAEIRQETQDKIDLQTKDDIHILGKMSQIYNKMIQLGFDATWLSLKTWSELKTKYLSNGQSTKWDIFNKLEQTNYFSSRNISNLGIRIVKILDKIKELDITMKEIITIKLINSFSSLFNTYFTILSQKTGNENKLSDLQTLFSNLEDKERCIKQTINFNLTYLHTANFGNDSIKDGYSSHAQGGRGSHRQDQLDQRRSDITGDTSGVTGTGKLSTSLSNQNNS